MADSENKISDLCVSCGMCCDGTLFGTAFVGDETNRRIAEDLELEILDIRGKLFFPLPCRHFSSCCSVYDKLRPPTCSSFFCPPIKRHKLQEQTLSETEKQIQLLRDNRDKLLTLASQFPDLKHLNFTDLKNKLEELGQDDEKVSQYGMLYLILFIFDDVKTKYFTPAKEDTLLV